MEPSISELSERIREAAARKTPLRIRAGGSKDFYAHKLEGELLDVSRHRGIVEYEPSELVMTARAGTPLMEIEEALAGAGQMLAFEPPHFGPHATLGGCVAAGFSGPRRATAGSVRDFVLGVRVLNSAGEDLRYGGQVMKNVAGFDLSRLMAGSFGTLGVITEVSLKVLPRPEAEGTVRLEMTEAKAIDVMNRWAGQPLPVSATCYMAGVLSVRLSGSQLGVSAAQAKIGGTPIADGTAFWRSIREQTLDAFAGPLWRLSIKPTTSPLAMAASQVIEWNGSLRWIVTELPGEQIFEIAREAGGRATRFRGQDGSALMQLDPPALTLHKRLKAALDPDGIFGPHRLHAEF